MVYVGNGGPPRRATGPRHISTWSGVAFNGGHCGAFGGILGGGMGRFSCREFCTYRINLWCTYNPSNYQDMEIMTIQGLTWGLGTGKMAA